MWAHPCHVSSFSIFSSALGYMWNSRPRPEKLQGLNKIGTAHTPHKQWWDIWLLLFPAKKVFSRIQKYKCVSFKATCPLLTVTGSFSKYAPRFHSCKIFMKPFIKTNIIQISVHLEGLLSICHLLGYEFNNSVRARQVGLCARATALMRTGDQTNNIFTKGWCLYGFTYLSK